MCKNLDRFLKLLNDHSALFTALVPENQYKILMALEYRFFDHVFPRIDKIVILSGCKVSTPI